MKKALLICEPGNRAARSFTESLEKAGYTVTRVDSISEGRKVFGPEFLRVSFGGNECTNEEAREGVFYVPDISAKRRIRMAAE